MIEISHDIPPVYGLLRSRFNVDWDDGLIIAWDGKIHCKGEPEPQKVVHEKVHLDEQGKMGNEAWWRLYLDNPDFRLAEEAKAYRAEMAFLRRNIKNREHLYRYAREIVDSLSGPIYGSMVSREDAFKLIK